MDEPSPAAPIDDGIQHPPPENTPPEPPQPPPPRPFGGPLLRWLFLFSLPISIAATVLGLYTHEFAHGLAALISGGHFIGIQGGKITRESSTLAYADAWSDGHEFLVLSAGIAANIVLGALFLWGAFRTRALMPRLILLLFASTFLSEFHYALEGCLAAEDAEMDTAMILKELDSTTARRLCTIGSLLGLGASTIVVALGLFRCWERIFGALSGGRALWVILLLSNPAPWPLTKGDRPNAMPMISLGLLVAVTITLLAARNRAAEQVPVKRFRRWSAGAFAMAFLAIVGFNGLRQGIQLGTFPSSVVRDIHPESGEVAGFSVFYGMGDRNGENRPVKECRLFLSRENQIRNVDFPPVTVIDVLWRPAPGRMLAACAEGLVSVDPTSGKIEWLWRPEKGRVTRADHGPRGELVMILNIPKDGEATEEHPLYFYDASRDVGTLRGNVQGVGNPIFASGSPRKAWMTVGEDLWEVEWLSEGEAVGVTRHGEASRGSWLAGLSGDQRWFSDETRWFCGEAELPFEGVSNWMIGPEGFYAVRKDDTWQLITPQGGVKKRGSIQTDSLLGFRIERSVAWVALKNGDVRPLDAGTEAFRVLLPR